LAFDLKSRKDDRPLRVLVVRVGAMGDVLHGLPAVAALREAQPNCYIGWAVETRWKPLLRAGQAAVRGMEMPLIDRIHEVPAQAWKRRPFSLDTVRQIAWLRREMRQQRYDVCIDLQGSIRSAVIGRLAGAKRFVGPATPREGLARLFYSERVALTKKHIVDQACELVAAATGITIEPATVMLPKDVEAGVAAELAAQRHLRPVVLIAPSAGWGAKEWGVVKYRELAARLRQSGAEVIVNAAARGDADAELIAADGNASVVMMNLAQLIEVTRRVNLVIGGDTGPVHLAAALGTPVVALFGPTDPARNGPYFPGARVQVLRDANSVTDHKRHAATETGLARITVEEVTAAALAMLKGKQNG